MPRIALKLEYFGKEFCGCQYQVGVRTVQRELEQALAIFLRRADERVKVIFSGRTDSGVHARGQVVHFDFDGQGPDDDLWRLCWGLNGILPPDMSVVAACIVPSTFHARFSALRRTYVYRILNRAQRSAFYRDTHSFIALPLDHKTMAQAAAGLVGQHDFKAFKSTNSDTLSTICRVERAELLNLGEGELEFWISANHFVYNMVRIIVGTLSEIGLGKRPSTDLVDALTGRQRHLAGPTAPPWGLCLDSVEYPEEFKLFTSDSFQESGPLSKAGDLKP